MEIRVRNEELNDVIKPEVLNMVEKLTKKINKELEH